MSVAFLVTSPYQLFHYKWIARHLTDVTAVIELRDTDFGLTEDIVAEHMPGAEIEFVSNARLAELDGKFDAIVCQTPILPLEFLSQSYIVAQQYSLAKEAYQYGAWRAHAQLNLMYGNYSVGKVAGFCNAVAAGNPLLDPYFSKAAPSRHSGRKRILYMPTYGELSSIKTVVPRLKNIDADVTLKLHHAHDKADLPSLPSHVAVVTSEADPVTLLSEADAVISDISGAAYDALYAGVPLILTGSVDPSSEDYRRLSDDERESHALQTVAAWWNPEDELTAALARAAELADSPEREELVREYFVNPGAAGEACAREIVGLIEHGEKPHFAARQVREATKRYILANRELRAKEKAVSPRPDQQLGLPLARKVVARVARRLVARSELLRTAATTIRNPRTIVTAPLPLPAPPREARETIWKLLAPYFSTNNVSVAREDDRPGSAVAFQEQQFAAVHRAFRQAAKDYPDLEVRVSLDKRTTYRGSLGSVKLADIRGGDRIRIGPLQTETATRPGLDGHLLILPVRRDIARNRYLSLYTRRDRVDWTELFDLPDREPAKRTTKPAPPPTGKVRPHAAAPVDIVYTWVDSTDPLWRQQHARYSEQHVTHNESANNSERYINREELRYSMRSVWMFAPFVRHIYLVTMDQRPSWLLDHPKVSLVSHKDIFPDASVLPTFNSHAIESCLHRIEGLSENFLYFNDDVFLGRETTEDDYFTMNGLAKLRFSPSGFIYEGEPEPSAIPTDWAAYNAAKLLGRDFSVRVNRRLMHVPLPLKRSVLHEIEERYAEEVERTRAARFRSPTDLAIPSMFGQYYSMATARAVEWKHSPNEYTYVDTGKANAHERYQRILTRRPKFFCINVTRYNEVPLEAQAAHLNKFVGSIFPVAAPWEET
jgi:hypothetical protein